MNDLNEEQEYILQSSERVGVILYTGESKDMEDLIERKLMKHVGKVCHCHDEYYKITITGKAEIERLKGIKA